MTVDPAATEGGIEDAGELFLPAVTGTARPDPRVLPASPVTRFAPAPTGYLHLGHLVNVLYVWGIAQATGGRVVLRIEDHDRQRSRPEYERALLEDLVRLGIAPDEPPVASFGAGPSPFRQSDNGDVYAAALDPLRAQGLVYACTCARSTFAAYEASTGRPWRGIGCPAGCRDQALPEDGDAGLRVAVGAGSERWLDLLAGPMADEPAATGDPLVRDRMGNWTYAWCVVVDDARHGIDLVIRGRDLLDATPVQLRLARLLGRETLAAVPPPPADPPRVRAEAVEGGGRHGDPVAPGCGTDAARAVRQRGAAGGAHGDRRPDRATRPGGAVRPLTTRSGCHGIRAVASLDTWRTMRRTGAKGERCARRRSYPASSRCGSSAPTSTSSSRNG